MIDQPNSLQAPLHFFNKKDKISNMVNIHFINIYYSQSILFYYCYFYLVEPFIPSMNLDEVITIYGFNVPIYIYNNNYFRNIYSYIIFITLKNIYYMPMLNNINC